MARNGETDSTSRVLCKCRVKKGTMSSRIGLWVLAPVLLLWPGLATAQPALPAGAVGRLGEFSSKDSGVSAVAYSPDGHTLASGESKQIRLWYPATGQELRRLENLPTGVYSLAF